MSRISSPPDSPAAKTASSGSVMHEDLIELPEIESYDLDDEDDTQLGSSDTRRRARQNIFRRFWRSVMSENWIFLAIVGISCSIVGLAIDLGISGLRVAQDKLIELIPSTAGAYTVWVVWSLVFAGLSIAAIEFISPNAAGSGIPEMKCILSGIEIDRFLNFRTLVAKIFGLIFAFAGGLSIGKEGPFVHISAIICSLLSKLRIFSHVRKNQAVLFQMLAAACGTGTTVAFGTPVGGVLFGIEVTSSFYFVDSLWRSFFVATCGLLVFVFSHRITSLEIFEAEWSVGTWDFRELIPFVVIGVFGGLLGGLFVQLMTLLFKATRLSPKMGTWWGHILRGLFVALIIALTAFPLPLVRNNLKETIEYLAKTEAIGDVGTLVGLVFAKFFFTLLSVAFTGCTAGIYSPTFLTGAAFGRIVGELMHMWFPTMAISPGAYAIVGAGAFAAGVTRTVSTVVLVIELTRQIRLLLPVMVAVLVSIGVGKLLTNSVYTVLIQQKDLPAMPRYKPNAKARVGTVAADVMSTDVNSVLVTSRFADIAKLVGESRDPSIPLVDSSGQFLGVVRRRALTAVLDSHRIVCKENQAELHDASGRCIAYVSYGSIHRDEAVPVTHVDVPAHHDPSAMESITGGMKQALHNITGNFDSSQMLVSSDDIFQQPVPYVFGGEGGPRDSNGVVEVDSSVLQISDRASLSKIHFLFTVLGLSHLFVTTRGRLVGVITRQRLIEVINSADSSRHLE